MRRAIAIALLPLFASGCFNLDALSRLYDAGVPNDAGVRPDLAIDLGKVSDLGSAGPDLLPADTCQLMPAGTLLFAEKADPTNAVALASIDQQRFLLAMISAGVLHPGLLSVVGMSFQELTSYACPGSCSAPRVGRAAAGDTNWPLSVLYSNNALGFRLDASMQSQGSSFTHTCSTGILGADVVSANGYYALASGCSDGFNLLFGPTSASVSYGAPTAEVRLATAARAAKSFLAFTNNPSTGNGFTSVTSVDLVGQTFTNSAPHDAAMLTGLGFDVTPDGTTQVLAGIDATSHLHIATSRPSWKDNALGAQAIATVNAPIGVASGPNHTLVVYQDQGGGCFAIPVENATGAIGSAFPLSATCVRPQVAYDATTSVTFPGGVFAVSSVDGGTGDVHLQLLSCL